MNGSAVSAVSTPLRRFIACGIAAILSTTVAAAWADTVRVVKLDGTEVRGTIKSFDDGQYIVTTPAGDIGIDVSQVRVIEAVGDTKTLPVRAPTAPADSGVGSKAVVAITTRDQTVVVGRIIAFEDGHYDVQTPGGSTQIALTDVVRVEQVPSTAAPAAGAIGGMINEASVATLTGGSLSISGSKASGQTFGRALIEAFAFKGGARNPIWSQRGQADQRSFIALAPNDRKLVAEFTLGGASHGLEELVSGQAQIAMIDRRMTAQEAQLLVAAGLGDPLRPEQEAAIAPLGVLAVVNPANPVKALTLAQVADILEGRIRSWSEVGGPARRIQVVVPDQDSGPLDIVKSALGRDIELAPTAHHVASSLEATDLASVDPAAFALTDLEDKGNTSALALSTDCGLSSAPTEFAIQSADYPLSGRRYFYTTSKASALVKDFVAFSQSATAQRAVQASGYTSLLPLVGDKGATTLDAVKVAKAVGMPEKFAREVGEFLGAARRLSVTVRFDEPGTAFNSGSESELDRLASFVRSGALGNRHFAIVGYAPASGNFNKDVELSKAGAVLAAEALRQRGVTASRVFGFGSLLPLDCDQTPVGRQRNRRVEIWIE